MIGRYKEENGAFFILVENWKLVIILNWSENGGLNECCKKGNTQIVCIEKCRFYFDPQDQNKEKANVKLNIVCLLIVAILTQAKAYVLSQLWSFF